MEIARILLISIKAFPGNHLNRVILNCFISRFRLSLVSGNKDGTECEQMTEDGKCCVFPFTFMGEKMHFCISGGPSEDDWCATTDDFDRDGEWGRCTGN